MLRSLLLTILDNLSQNPKGGFLGFLASLAVSVVPSILPPHLLVQVQQTDQLLVMDVIVKIIQIIAGLIGIMLSSMMIYIKWPKVMEMFKKRKPKEIENENDNEE